VTVLVGIKCKDGIVIGSDSSVTFGAGGGSTIEQTARKIEIIEGSIICAGTGQLGLGQRFCHQLTEGYKNKRFANLGAIDTGRVMTELAIGDFSKTQVKAGQYGALVAFVAKKELQLCEFASTDFQPELKTDQIWYASMGSGQAIADPFLGLMRKVFWGNGMPNLSDGAFIAAWTLKHTIDVNAGGVNGPINLATLRMVDDRPVAVYLTQEQLEQHLESVAGAETHLAAYRDALQGSGHADVPDVPRPLS
jgi:Proteasome subunit